MKQVALYDGYVWHRVREQVKNEAYLAGISITHNLRLVTDIKRSVVNIVRDEHELRRQSLLET